MVSHIYSIGFGHQKSQDCPSPVEPHSQVQPPPVLPWVQEKINSNLTQGEHLSRWGRRWGGRVKHQGTVCTGPGSEPQAWRTLRPATRWHLLKVTRRGLVKAVGWQSHCKDTSHRGEAAPASISLGEGLPPSGEPPAPPVLSSLCPAQSDAMLAPSISPSMPTQHWAWRSLWGRQRGSFHPSPPARTSSLISGVVFPQLWEWPP